MSLMMNPADKPSDEDIFDRALACEGAARDSLLDTLCMNGAQRARVEALLKAHSAMHSGFLEEPAEQYGLTMVLPAAALPSGLLEKPGDWIGSYKLLQQIGEGGFGTVWMAEQEKPVRRRVALKIIKLGMDTKEVVARFEQERQALAMMDHPNIARVFDAGATEQGRPFFVMELVRGVKITDYCDEQELSNEERIGLFIDVCQAVQHAHQKGVIHRDLKPSNILVTVNDGKAVPKVIDFGVAKAMHGRLTEATLFTQFEQMIGTPLYMSPEQAEMSSLDVDTRSDIYSLGVLLYELLTGHTPIALAAMARAGMGEIRRLIRETDPPRPSQRFKTLDGNELTSVAKRRHTDAARLQGALRGDMDWIVMKCLEKDRQRRYETATGLALDLQRHLRNEVITARPPTTSYLLGKLIRRNKVAFAASAAIAASLVVGIAASLWQAVRAKAAEREAVAAFDELRATAPAFAEQARSLTAQGRYDDAIEKLDYAIKLQPDASEHWVAKADLLRCQLRLTDAAAIYREALRVEPGLTRAETSARLCEELFVAPTNSDGKLTRESLARLHLAMQQQQRPAAELLPVARLLGEEKKLLTAYWLERLKDLPVSEERPLRERLTIREDGWLALDLSDTKVLDLSLLSDAPVGVLNLSRCTDLSDISPLRRIKLVELDISATSVQDLAPLREMHTLKSLNLADSKVTDLSELGELKLNTLAFSGCEVGDLSPVRGMHLEKMDLKRTRVTDLSPLIGMPIRSIDLSMVPVTDFSPLAELPLEACYLQRTRIVDLSVLRRLPLKELVLWGCVAARNYAVLGEIKTLELLQLPSEYRSLSEQDYNAIGALRDHPKLRQLGADNMSQMDYAATSSKEVFWRDWDREQTFTQALRKSGLRFNLWKANDGYYGLTLTRQPLTDLSILKGAPISYLVINWCKVSDLSPLRGMPLRYLHIGATPVTDLSPLRDTPVKELWMSLSPVTDLSPLRGMKLEKLMLHHGQVSDISPLAGMPLKRLDLSNCKNVTDVAPVLKIPTLEELTVPFGARNIGLLRKMPNLRRLAYNIDRVTGEVDADTTAKDFWRDFDANPWIASLSDAGLTPKEITRRQDGTWHVDFDGVMISDVSLLKGARISSLNLAGTNVTDLRPIADLPLETLNIQRTKVADLSFLVDARIATSLCDLDVSGVKVTDFSPLAACTKLVTLRIYSTAFADLSVVKSKNLKALWMANTRVADLSPLAGMSLREVYLDGCLAVTDISPLGRCSELERLVLPDNVNGMGSLRGLPMLKYISNKYNPAKNAPAADFWKEYDAAFWITRLQEAGIKPVKLEQLGDGTWEVDLQETKIKDLSILRGASISSLQIARTAVTDLEPLRGMPLKKLWIFETSVSDLAPLQGMALTLLHLRGTQVRDLSVLRGMPLNVLRLHECDQITDLSPLKDARELIELTLPPNAANYEFFRASFPKLQRIAFNDDIKSYNRSKSNTVEFWKAYDARVAREQAAQLEAGIQVK